MGNEYTCLTLDKVVDALIVLDEDASLSALDKDADDEDLSLSTLDDEDRDVALSSLDEDASLSTLDKDIDDVPLSALDSDADEENVPLSSFDPTADALLMLDPTATTDASSTLVDDENVPLDINVTVVEGNDAAPHSIVQP